VWPSCACPHISHDADLDVWVEKEERWDYYHGDFKKEREWGCKRVIFMPPVRSDADTRIAFNGGIDTYMIVIRVLVHFLPLSTLSLHIRRSVRAGGTGGGCCWACGECSRLG